MEINGFWDYARRWEKIFKQEKGLRWEADWMENDYCAACKFCCGPQDSDVPFPMPLLPSQCDAHTHERFHLLDNKTPYLARSGCKSDSPHGCKLALSQKPIACGLFPIVFANGTLRLYQNCPAVIYTPLARFMEFGKKAADFLMQYTYQELLHLSICLTENELARSYINLRITLLKDGKKMLVME